MTERVPANATVDGTLSPWCHSVWKRLLDLFWSLFFLILFSPVMLIVSLAVKLTSRGPVFFRQRRPAMNGREFSILKFRTMVVTAQEAGPVLTKARDPRITWMGRHIRRWKLDELPQLFNVIRGDMSFVGPRPQPTRLWNEPSIQEDAGIVLSVRPGITSQATLVFRNEEEVLAPLPFDEVEEIYLRTLMPIKLKIEIQYLRQASFSTDLHIILRTVARIFRPRKDADDHLKEFLPALNESQGGEEEWVSSQPSWARLSDLEDASTITKSTASREEGTRT